MLTYNQEQLFFKALRFDNYPQESYPNYDYYIQAQIPDNTEEVFELPVNMVSSLSKYISRMPDSNITGTKLILPIDTQGSSYSYKTAKPIIGHIGSNIYNMISIKIENNDYKVLKGAIFERVLSILYPIMHLSVEVKIDNYRIIVSRVILNIHPKVLCKLTPMDRLIVNDIIPMFSLKSSNNLFYSEPRVNYNGLTKTEIRISDRNLLLLSKAEEVPNNSFNNLNNKISQFLIDNIDNVTQL